jgi:hypothetical protein
VAEALVAGAGEEFEVAGDVSVQGGVEQGDGDVLCQFEGADLAGVGDDGEEALLDRWGVVVLLVGRAEVDGEEATGDGCSGGGDLDASSADGVIEVDVGGVVG